MTLEDRKYLTVPLPEDVEKRKMIGDFDRELKLIERKLKTSLSLAMRKRLELERELIPVLKAEYPFSYDEAFKILQSNIRDFTKEEFEELIDENFFDWIFIDGKIHFIRHFYENAEKVKHPIMKRLIHAEDPAVETAHQEHLNSNMRIMKEQGGRAFRFRIRTELKILPCAERVGEKITIHIPIPTESTQVENIKILSYSEPNALIAPEDYPSRTICFRGLLHKDQQFWVEYSYETHMKYVNPDPDAVLQKQLDFYTQEQAPHIMFTPFIRSLYEEIVGSEKNPLRKAKMIFEYLTSHVKYSYVRTYSTFLNIPEYAAANSKGDCGIQALLFVTLCRCGGIPARWQSGLYVTPDNIDGHDWAQFYVAPYGWLFADLSFGGSAYRIGNEERRQFYFGNIDPFRMPANNEFHYEFMPAKKFSRQDPTDNQYGECEYDDRGLGKKEYTSKHELLEIKELSWEEKDR